MRHNAAGIAIIVSVIFGANVVAAGVFRVMADIVLGIAWLADNWVAWGLVGLCAVLAAMAFLAGAVPACINIAKRWEH